jgi:alpha-L-fucosidase
MAAGLCIAAGSVYGESQLPKSIFNETPERRAQRQAWWRHDRFGMFIHFGLYSMPARHEWVRSREQIPAEVYDSKYPSRFNPDLFDAREWARSAKAAGMKYIVLTTKHHEGFCMWDTKTTDYKITKSPFGRDLVKEYVAACREEGLKVGFYYSIIDWHHPDFTIDVTHPLRPRGGFTDESYARLNRAATWPDTASICSRRSANC